MEKDDFRLVCLMEELAEAAQRASKQLRFGRNEVQPGQPLPKHKRLREELLDVLVVIRDLARYSQIEEISLVQVIEHENYKLPKMKESLAMVDYVMKVQHFRLPNFVRVAGPHQSEAEEHMIDVALMSDEQAVEYWDGMKTAWLNHIAQRRAINEAAPKERA